MSIFLKNQKYRSVVTFSIIALLSFATYAPTFSIGFLNDDIANIESALNNFHHGFASLFSKGSLYGQYFRPVVDLSFVIDYSIWGWAPFGFRLTNLLLHLLNVLFVFLLSKKLFESEPVALASALLFGVLPIHELSILWIPGRTDILCSVFCLSSVLTIIEYAQNKRKIWLFWSLILYVLALLSKEMAFSLPLLVVLIASRNASSIGFSKSFRSGIKLALPFVFISLFAILLRWISLDNNLLFGPQGLHGYISIPGLIKNLVSYLGLLAIPIGHYEIASFLSGYPLLFFLLSSLVLVALTYLLWRFNNKILPLVFCSLWILITLIPVSRLMMRWYLYIPSVGFCFALGWVVWYLTKADKVKFIGIVAIVWTLYASISFERTLDWAKTSTFAEGLLAQVREQTQLTSPNDTLTFVTIPSRLKTTPLFHLGFEHTLRHSLRHDNVFVAFWPKIIMEEPGTVVAASLIPNENKILVSIDSLGYLFLDVEQFMTKRIAPEPGMKFKSGGISVELLEVTEDDKVLKFLFSTDWNLHRNLFFFDGQKFIRML